MAAITVSQKLNKRVTVGINEEVSSEKEQSLSHEMKTLAAISCFNEETDGETWILSGSEIIQRVENKRIGGLKCAES
ncbi:MAG: hypothetical protein ACXQT5_01665 [Candidatus Syntropharchaeia archaeon]